MRAKNLIILGTALSCFLVGWNRPVYGDCESDRFDAFFAADSQYTDTFRLWYFGQPTSCQQDCQAQCNAIADPVEKQQCLNNINNCIDSCDASRYASYTSAQDSLMQVAMQSCPYNLDECAAARGRRDQCVANFNAYLANPVYDENGNFESTWAAFVLGEYGACRAASGVDNCE